MLDPSTINSSARVLMFAIIGFGVLWLALMSWEVLATIHRFHWSKRREAKLETERSTAGRRSGARGS